MRLTGTKTSRLYQFADTILSTPLTAGVASFQFAWAHDIEEGILGGTAAVQHEGLTIVAFETFGTQAVPEPSSLAIVGLMALVGCGVQRRRMV